MHTVSADPARIRAAWEGRASGCLLGKPVEVLLFEQARSGLSLYLQELDALPLRDSVPLKEGSLVDRLGRHSCRGHISRAAPDDAINYTVLALMLPEDKGTSFETRDVACAWAGRVGVSLAGCSELKLDDLVDRTVTVTEILKEQGTA